MEYDFEFSEFGICNAFGRLKRIKKRLKEELQLTPQDVVLEIGCNKGDLAAFLRPSCEKVIGIDINKDAINSSNVPDLKIMDARRTDFPDGYFTKIVTSMAIEHIPDPTALFKEIDRIIKPGGLAVLHYPWELFRGMGTMRNALIFYKNPFKGYKIHVNKLNHKKIENLTKGTGLRVIRKKFFFDPQPGYITILKKDCTAVGG